jgi:hypothetical protein
VSDLSAYSDADLLASLPVGIRNNNPLNMKGEDGQFMAFTSPDQGMAAADQNLLAYGTKHGINTIAGVTARWAPKGDGNNDPSAYAQYISQRTGISPDQHIDLTDAATRQALLGPMSEFETGQQQKGRDLSQVSDADLLASIHGAPTPQSTPASPEREIGASHNRGVVISVATPASSPASAPQPAQPNPTIAQDALSGFLQPFQNLGHDVMQQYRVQTGNGLKPASIADSARLVGDVVGAIPQAVQGAFVRPTARAVNRALPTPTQAPQLVMVNGKPVLTAPRQLQGADAQMAVENAINTSISGATAAAPGWKLGAGYAATAQATPSSLAEIKAASDAAWNAVGNSKFRFAPQDSQAAAADIAKTFNDAGGADLYPRSAPLVKRIESLASDPNGLSVDQVSRLRSQIGEKLLQPGSDEASMGALMKDKLEGLIQTANDPNLAQARDLYTRYKKMQTLTQAAEVAADKLPANGNITQPMRTQAQQLVSPKSSARIGNLTPDETAALKKLARGTANQGPAITVGRVFDPRSLLGTTINSMLGLMTGGHAPLVTAPLGMVSTAMSNAGTKKGIQQALDLMSIGGAKPAPVYPTLALGGRPAIPIASPTGLFGAGFLAQLPPQIRALLENSQTTPKAAQPAR